MPERRNSREAGPCWKTGGQNWPRPNLSLKTPGRSWTKARRTGKGSQGADDGWKEYHEGLARIAEAESAAEEVTKAEEEIRKGG